MTDATSTVLDHLCSHRSVRSYRGDPVDEGVLRDCLAAGLRASSSGNMQTYSVIVTSDRALRERLFEPHMRQSMVLDAPLLLTFCADLHRMRRWLARSDAPDGFDDLMTFMVAAIDAVLASQNVALAAEAHGLGVCYMGSTLANCDMVGEVLELPPSVVPVVGFSLGHPAEDPAPRDRLPLDGIVHRETYRVPSDERLDEIYAEREVRGWERYMAVPDLRARVEAAGVTNLAQLYSAVKYTRASHHAFSGRVRAYLARQGFAGDLEGAAEPRAASRRGDA